MRSNGCHLRQARRGSNRAETIAAARKLLNLAPPAAEQTSETDPAQPLALPCPCCGGRMFVIETFAAGCQPHVTGQPRLSSQSGSIPHERGHLTHHRPLSVLVIDRQRCCSAQYVPGIAFEVARIAQTQRQHRSFKADQPIQRPQSHDPRASTAPAHARISFVSFPSTKAEERKMGGQHSNRGAG